MTLGHLLKRERDIEGPLRELFFTTIYASDQFERRFADFLRPFGVTPCQYDILAILWDAGGRLPIGDIGERLVRQTSALGAYVDRLAKADLVTRERSETDRRQVYAVLSSDGANALEKIHESLENWEELLIGHLTTSEAEVTTKVLKKATERLPN